MSDACLQVKVPGKLLIAGDYAVVEQDQQAIVVAVDRYITASIKRRNMFSLSIPDLGVEKVEWEQAKGHKPFCFEDPRLKFIENSLEVVSKFFQEKAIEMVPFHLQMHSELNDSITRRKYGLGSSAAVVVATISAILHLHYPKNCPPIEEEIFKLASISHLMTQKNGSGIDIAASTYGGWVFYAAYRPDWVLKELETGKSLSSLIEKSWPHLKIEPLKAPENFKLCVGWTGEPASTAPMVEKVRTFQQKCPKEYYAFLQASTYAVEKLKNSLNTNNYQGLLTSISKNRLALQKLGEQVQIPIETPKLKRLADIAEKYGSGKSSGAGGGDCGIAFVKDGVEQERLYKKWTAVGIQPLRLSIAKDGATVITDNEEHP